MEFISIAFSLVALTAAVTSLALQASDLFASRHQALRGTQLELVRMATENPVMYLGYEPTGEQRNQFVNRSFVNALMKYYELGFLTGTLSETEIRHQMTELFANDGPRLAWAAFRTTWQIEATSRKRRRFVEIVEHEFHNASRSTPTT